MIVKKGFYYYDITCDRCGKSLAEYLYEKYGPGKEQYDPSFKRDCFYVGRFDWIKEMISTSNQIIHGWSYNKQNNTFVCNDCELILTTKKGESNGMSN